MAYSFKLKYILLILFACSTLTSLAQREKNYVYLFDCTGSMHANELWNTAQSALDSNIALRTSIPGAHFTVIPFGDIPYETISFDNTEYSGKKQDISKSFDKYIHQARVTNISGVLKSGFSHVNSNKDNEIYLFTDGMPNGGDTPQKVAQTINEWCANHHDAKLFYVALTNGVINPVIKQAIDACPDASIVQCENGIIPVITNISNDVYTNLEELDNIIEMSFSIPGAFNLIASSSDRLFDFNIPGGQATNGKVNVKVSPKESLSIDELHQILQGNDYDFQATVRCADPHFVIVNPIVNVHVSDEVPARLSFAQEVDELQTTPAAWHDSFLWSDAAPDEKVVWDLTPAFKNELHNSRLVLKFQAADGQSNDFQAWFNGQVVSNGSTISIEPGKPTVLEVLFNHDATTGKRYFSLTPVSITSLDFINGMPADDYKGTSLRTDYNVGWNPLKTLMFWLAIALACCLLLWFLIFKRIFFPSIKMGTITLTGPGTYYVSKKIKGAHKVVLTSKRKTQNIFSRIFTGKIKFIMADHFSPELSIVPVGRKKKVKLRPGGNTVNSWDIYPSSIFAQCDKGSISNRTSHEKSEIEFN